MRTLFLRHCKKRGEELSPEGIEQAHVLGTELKTQGWQFVRVIASQSPRAQKTSEILRQELGVDVEIETNERFYFPLPKWDVWKTEIRCHPEYRDALSTFLQLWPEFIEEQARVLLEEIKGILQATPGDVLCIGHSPFLPGVGWLITGEVRETDFGEGFVFSLEGDEIRGTKF